MELWKRDNKPRRVLGQRTQRVPMLRHSSCNLIKGLPPLSSPPPSRPTPHTAATRRRRSHSSYFFVFSWMPVDVFLDDSKVNITTEDFDGPWKIGNFCFLRTLPSERERSLFSPRSACIRSYIFAHCISRVSRVVTVHFIRLNLYSTVLIISVH